MKLEYDRNKIKESIQLGGYDNRNLAICKCGKHRYPSKLMLIKFLEQFKDVKGNADIWSMNDGLKGEVQIHCDITYKVSNEVTAISPVIDRVVKKE